MLRFERLAPSQYNLGRRTAEATSIESKVRIARPKPEDSNARPKAQSRLVNNVMMTRNVGRELANIPREGHSARKYFNELQPNCI